MKLCFDLTIVTAKNTDGGPRLILTAIRIFDYASCKAAAALVKAKCFGFVGVSRMVCVVRSTDPSLDGLVVGDQLSLKDVCKIFGVSW